MKWEILKKAWQLARSKFPKTQRLYVHPPRSFALKGSCQVVDLEKPEEVMASIDYEIGMDGQRPVIQLSLLGESAKVALASVQENIKVSKKSVVIPKPPEVDYRLMANKYRDPFDLGLKLAMLAAIKLGETPQEADVESWMKDNLIPVIMRLPIEEGLESLGVRLVTERQFNIREVNAKKMFQENQRVRIVHPTSMELQEVGTIREIKGKPKTGYWYSVLVDGSSSPLWFPESALKANEAGMVVNPVPEPVADE